MRVEWLFAAVAYGWQLCGRSEPLFVIAYCNLSTSLNVELCELETYFPVGVESLMKGIRS